MRWNDYEKLIQRQDMDKGMGGKSDYEKMVMAAVVHDIGKFWQGTGEEGVQHLISFFSEIHIRRNCISLQVFKERC